MRMTSAQELRVLLKLPNRIRKDLRWDQRTTEGAKSRNRQYTSTRAPGQLLHLVTATATVLLLLTLGNAADARESAPLMPAIEPGRNRAPYSQSAVDSYSLGVGALGSGLQKNERGVSEASTLSVLACVPTSQVDVTCDGIDDDCDGAIDENAPVSDWFADRDGDSHGDGSDKVTSCAPPSGYVGSNDDCVDGDSRIYSGAQEENDGVDNQCAGDVGFGEVDEISGQIRFSPPGSFCWDAQPQASQYEVRRSDTSELTRACWTKQSNQACVSDPDTPAPGQAFFYLVRSTGPNVGSWGKDSLTSERNPTCAEVTAVVSESFDAGVPPGWDTYCGNFSVANGVATLSYGLVNLPDPIDRRSGVRIEADVNILWGGAGDFNIFVMHDPALSGANQCYNPYSGYNFGYYPDGSDNSYDLFQEVENGAGTLEQRSTSNRLHAGEWGHVSAELWPDGTIRSFINGHEIITSSSDRWQRGSLGLRSWGDVLIDNLKISTLEPRDSQPVTGWKQLDTQLPYPMAAVSATAYDDHVLVHSAYRPAHQVVLDIDRATGEITGSREQDLPTGMLPYQRSAVIGDTYIVPGYQETYLGALQPDGTVSSWTTGPAPLGSYAGGDSRAIVTLGRVVFLAGWHNNETNTPVESAVLQPDGTLSNWTTQNPINVVLHDTMAMVAYGYLYVYGGEGLSPSGDLTNARDVRRARILDNAGTLGPWESVGTMLVARPHSSSFVRGNDLYVAGGGVHSYITDAVESAPKELFGTTGRHRLGTPLPIPVNGAGGVTVGRWSYVLGGDSQEFGGNPRQEIWRAQFDAFHDDFGDGVLDSSWRTPAGSWSESGGVLHGTNTAANTPIELYWNKGFQWRKYTVEADVEALSGYSPADAQLDFLYQSPTNFYACKLFQGVPAAGQSAGHYLILDIPGVGATYTPFNYNIGEFYRLRADVHGQLVSCEVVGVPGAKVTSNLSGSPSGTVGLRNTHIPADFDNVRVYDVVDP